MNVPLSPINRQNPYRRRPALSGLQETPAYRRAKTVGDMGALGAAVVRGLVAPPYTWWRDALVEISLAYRRTAIPMLISHSVFVLGFGLLLFGGIIQDLGLPERHAGVMSIFWSRELATWITGMVFAGVVGSAVTADLGARKIREELDALAVLGVRQLSALVLPRVLACTIAMPTLALLSLVIINGVEFATAPSYFGLPAAELADGLVNTIVPTDIYLTVFLKNLILGFFVGIVACYKGLSSDAGADGVGRAVNQTVVITFFGIWFFNSVFNFAYFTAFPDVASFRG